jgi:glycosyltransferase involved in cell wall biosynthesis
VNYVAGCNEHFTPDKTVNILLVNSSDRGGGAEKIAYSCLGGFLAAGHEAWLAVGAKHTDCERVLAFADLAPPPRWQEICARSAGAVQRRLGASSFVGRASGSLSRRLAQPVRAVRTCLGHEDFAFPASRAILDLLSDKAINLVHCHNLHGGFFDLRLLLELSQRVPVVITLHDAWLLSGHCVHSLGCERWKTGCGSCPDVTIYPALRRDATAHNWRRKRALYAACRLHIAAPSRWLMEKVKGSILAPAVADARVVPNGVDLTVFSPGDQATARRRVGLPEKGRIVLFAANGVRHNVFKDFDTLRAALAQVSDARAGEELCFVGLGTDAVSERVTGADIRFAPFEANEARMAEYYRAADVFVHAAKADTFPTTVLEAAACGTPVVASAVGGVPEQIQEGVTGFLVPAADARTMAGRISHLLGNDALRNSMKQGAITRARSEYDCKRMAGDYLAWFHGIVAEDLTDKAHAQSD